MPRRWLAWVALAAWVPVCASAGSRHPAEGREPEARSRSSLPELSRLAETALPAVVGIVTTQGARPPLAPGDPLNEALEHLRGDVPRHGLASGFIVQGDGYILTNAHVVEGVAQVEVELGEDGERFPARVVGLDQASDVALVKVVAGRPLPTLPLGDSDRVRIAEWVMVVGNPFGLAHTVTVGIVSHTGRSDVVPAGRDGCYDFIQTDASINPGSSGGPILNLRGEVVGIATAINATGQGIGFAVPINMAKEILPQLRAHGRVLRSWMGVSVRELRLGASRGLRRRQVVVTDVVNGSPAASSGLAVGDVITGFEGRGVPSAARLRWYVATAGVGRHVALTVRRGAAERSVQVALVAEAPHVERTAQAPASGVATEAPSLDDE